MGNNEWKLVKRCLIDVTKGCPRGLNHFRPAWSAWLAHGGLWGRQQGLGGDGEGRQNSEMVWIKETIGDFPTLPMAPIFCSSACFFGFGGFCFDQSKSSKKKNQ